MDDVSLVLKYFPGLSHSQLSKFRQLGELYSYWNEKVNVISRTDIEFLYEHHVLHSLGLAKITTLKKGTSVLDIGTGGGFPGIPLAILFPEVQFTLADSIQKKTKVVQEICKTINVENVTIFNGRAEDIKGLYDFSISRAVTKLYQLLKWSKDKIKIESINSIANGLFCYKGGNITDELSGINPGIHSRVYNLGDFFPGSFFLEKKIIHIPVKPVNKK